MKNTYRVILMTLVVLGIVYAGTVPEKKNEKAEKKNKEGWYKPIVICKFPVSMEVGHYVQLKECHKRKIELKQVTCKSIGRDGGDFPCYKGSDVIEVRANFPAVLSASLDKSVGDKDMLKDYNLYWENGINTIQGAGVWEELTLCLEAWDVEMWKSPPETVNVGDITIEVSPPNEPNDIPLED